LLDLFLGKKKGEMDTLNVLVFERDFKERIRWLIQLRWFAGIGVFIVITFAKTFITEGLPWPLLYLGNGLLLSYNALFYLYFKKIKSEKDIHLWFEKANRFANFQISLDYFLLAYLIHFSGGVENPFVFYFIFHVVLASVLLSKRAVYFQAFIAIVYVAVICFGEYYKFIPHYSLTGFFPNALTPVGHWYSTGGFIVFASTLIFTCFIATSFVDRLKEGEKELAIVNTKLEQQDRLRSQYVLTVSHDLQASLSAIQSCLKVVLLNLTGVIPEKAREMIARAENRSRAILHFVKDLLDLSRFRAEAQFEKDKISLKNLLQKIVNQMKLRVNEKEITIKIEHVNNMRVLADPAMLEHAFLNLIQNAIRYTPQGGEISIRSHEPRDNGFLQVSVSDTGIGISHDDIPHIFEDFYRAENAVIMEQNGTGLGLAIVKKIIEDHGGEIHVESEIGKGSQFIISLPVPD